MIDRTVKPGPQMTGEKIRFQWNISTELEKKVVSTLSHKPNIDDTE